MRFKSLHFCFILNFGILTNVYGLMRFCLDIRLRTSCKCFEQFCVAMLAFISLILLSVYCLIIAIFEIIVSNFDIKFHISLVKLSWICSIGDRDWNQSHVYRMINETRTNERQVYPSGQGNQPITTKTVQTTQKTYSYDYQPTMEDGYGVSEF